MFIIFLPNFSGRFAENAIFVSTETFWGEVFLWKTSLLPLLSHIDREFFGQLSMFLTVSLKLHSTCIEKWFEQEIMKNWYFFIFSDFERSFSRFFLKICQWCCQNWFLHPQRNVLWKNVFVEKNYNFLSLSHIERKKLDFVETVLAWMSNLHSTCPLEYFEEKGLCWKLFFQIMTFGQWANFFSDFCRKVLGRGIQNCNLHINRKFLRKVSSLQWKNPFFLFFSKKIFWRVVFVWENIFFPFFWWWLKVFQSTATKVPTELSKPHYASPEEKFEEKYVVLRIYNINLYIRTI